MLRKIVKAWKLHWYGLEKDEQLTSWEHDYNLQVQIKKRMITISGYSHREG